VFGREPAPEVALGNAQNAASGKHQAMRYIVGSSINGIEPVYLLLVGVLLSCLQPSVLVASVMRPQCTILAFA